MQYAANFFTDKLDIPADTVNQALELQKEKGGDLLRLLMRQDTVNEIDLLHKLGNELEMEFSFSLPSEIQTDFTAALPISFLKKHLMVPVVANDDAFIAINDPFDFQSVDELRQVLNRTQKPRDGQL